MRAILLLVAAACTNEGHGPAPAPCAVEDVTGTIPGVAITVRGDSCVLARGQDAQFTYEVTTTASVPAIHVLGSDGGCGSCRAPQENPLSWVRWNIGGGDQNYCLCDTGCCAPDTEQTIQPIAATESATIDWTGNTWHGPSDTGNPQGDPFVPGHYNVTVVFNGHDRGTVTANLPIEVQ